MLIDILAVVAHVLIAGSVTAHILLTKDDVRSATGWIGIAWLSPVVGALVYFALGINRVSRRALQLERVEYERSNGGGGVLPPAASGNIVGLAEIGRRVTGLPLAGGNGITILKGGDKAYPEMLAAIREARHSIALASYIFFDDAVGEAFVDALIDAHKRGVEVRVLLDSVGSGYFRSAVLQRLHAAGVPGRRFLHVWMPWRMPFINMRNHKKILVVDGVTGFTGGMNIGVLNSERLKPKDFIEDVHLRVEGPIVGQLMDSFAQDWSFTTDELLDQAIWWPDQSAAGPVFARAIPSGPDADLYKLETILGAALAQARSRVRIVTPYFLPDQRLQFALAQAALRGVDVEIVIPEHSDHAYFDWAVRAHLRLFRDSRIHLHLSRFHFDHSKLMTVDGEWCLIGSSNWDTRSLRLNFEFDLECYDADFARAIDGLIDEKIVEGRKLEADELMSVPRWVELRDAAARLLLPYL
jgi:cardiolipin synthase